ncbi:MAG: TonB-dependent receptor [Bacteroidales bacterium]
MNNPRLVTIPFVLMLILSLFRVCQAQKVDSISTQALFSMSLDELMEVNIVSSTRQEQTLLEAPSVMSIITKEQLREGQYRSVAEAMEFIAGIDVITDHFQPNVGIRGVHGGLRSYSRLMKVMIDGQPVSFAYNANNYLGPSLIPMTAIDKIEIIRGPNSAIYGENAFLGVINIITKNSKAAYNGSFQQSVGAIEDNSNYQMSTSLFTEGKYLKVNLSAQAGKYDLAGLEPVPIPHTNAPPAKATTGEHSPTSFYLKMSYEDKTLGKITLNSHAQILDNYFEFCDWSPLTHNNRVSIYNGQYSLFWEKDLSEKWQAETTLGYHTGSPRNTERIDGDGDPLNWVERKGRHDGWHLSINNTWKLKDENNISFGADYNYDDYEIFTYYTLNANGFRTVNPGSSTRNADFSNFGLHAQTIMHPYSWLKQAWLNPLSITAGIRYDLHNIYGDVLNYRLAGVYEIAPKINAKVMFGTSFNPPSAYQLYTNYIKPGGIVGNPDLKPEKAKTFEVALQGQLGENHYFQGTLFSTQIENKVEFLLPYGLIQNITAANVSQIHAPGLELEWTYYWFNVKTTASYSYQHAMVEKTTPLWGQIRVATDLYPRHQIKLKELYEWKRYQSTFLLEGLYISERIASETNNFHYNSIGYNINRYSLDPYIKLNFTFTNKSLELIPQKPTYISLKIKNLLDSQYAYPGYVGYDIPGLGRSFYLVFQQYF